jgi:hypothetical protein
MEAAMVPPVARRSCRVTTRWPFSTALDWISMVSVPYSSSYSWPMISPRELAFFAGHGETEAETGRQRRLHQEPPGFNAGQNVGLVLANHFRQSIQCHLPGVGMGQQGGNVVKKNTWFGEIGNRTDVVFEVHGLS